MKSPGSSGSFLLAACSACFLAVAASASSPTYTITATNVTLPGGGNPGTSHFTLTSVNGYSGKIVVNSQYSGGDMNVKPPNCGMYTSVLFTLKANSTVSGTLTCYKYGTGVPAVRLERPPGLGYHPVMLGLAFAGWFALRRRLRSASGRWLSLLLLGVVSVVGMEACGGNALSGTYPFTVTATDSVTQASVSTSITVTVP